MSLRTPLTTVLGYAELHRRGALAGTDAQDDAWSRTEAEAARMRRLVEDMLTLAKYDAEPDLEPARRVPRDPRHRDRRERHGRVPGDGVHVWRG
ncbi:histidine kinase dimerization/phospho-acceptor domain-containing protein [Demequina litorisediminis]|nr:histidine kinase dimerization/phospho-acceptor domain-containing protein [Demequina litorisediminis]